MNEIVDRRTRAYREQQAETMNAPAAPATDLPQRPARKPFGGMTQKMAYAQREGFHRHWFNDTPGRIGRALEAGYEHVKGHDGKPVSMPVSSTEPLIAFLMEIPEEWYNQDMAQEQRIIDDKEASMKRGVADGPEGEGQYVPKQGIKISRG